jgi:hypothetical protein
MELTAYKATLEQLNASLEKAETFLSLARESTAQGAPAPYALKIARDALEDANFYIALARAELEREGGSQ